MAYNRVHCTVPHNVFLIPMYTSRKLKIGDHSSVDLREDPFTELSHLQIKFNCMTSYLSEVINKLKISCNNLNPHQIHISTTQERASVSQHEQGRSSPTHNQNHKAGNKKRDKSNCGQAKHRKPGSQCAD